MKLPINTHPLLLARDPEAYIFAMMTAKDEKALPFLLSRFISVAAYNDTSNTEAVIGYNNNYVDYYLWRSGKLRLDTVQIPNDVAYDGLAVNIIKSLLDTGEYVIGIWNEQYVPCKRSHMNNYMAADFLLYGYDDKAQQFNNFGWNGGGLTEFTVSYDIMSKALPLKDPPMHLLWGASVADADSSFDVVNTAAELREFVSANGSNHDSCAFGYKAIEYLAHDVRTRQKAIGCIDKREMLFLQELVALMRIRIDYLISNGIINNSELLSKALRAEQDACNISCMGDQNKYNEAAKAIMLLSQSMKDIAQSLLIELEGNHAAAV